MDVEWIKKLFTNKPDPVDLPMPEGIPDSKKLDFGPPEKEKGMGFNITLFKIRW